MVISSLAPSGPARQLALVAAALPPGAVHIVALGGATEWGAELRRRGVAVEEIGWVRPLDLRAALALRRAVKAHRPDIIHAWTAGAARALLLTGSCRAGRLVVSGATTAGRWLLRRCRRVIAFGGEEAAGYRRLGLDEPRLAVVPPGVPLAPEGDHATLPGLPADARVVLCLGPIERHKGHREAVWAFDMVKPIDDRLHLVIVGTGDGAARVRDFVRGTGGEARVHLIGPVADAAGWLRRAEVVLVPSLRDGGRYAALDALAAGRPVIASALPGLVELMPPDEPGLLVPPDDKLALARALRALLDDEPRRRRLGEAARDHAAGRFPVAETVRVLVGVYGAAP